MAYGPWVEKEACISCDICKDNCPEVFRLDAHGKSECHDPEGASEETVRTMAIELCPVSCILWLDQELGPEQHQEV